MVVSAKILAVIVMVGALHMEAFGDSKSCPEYLDHEVKRLHSSETVELCQEYAGKPLLIVNTASHCGFTPQFKGLEALHQKYKDRGLVVLGFPSNDFFQESSDESETAEVCYINYGVTFPMMSTVSVRGSSAHPIFKELARQSGAPLWNFYKYVINAEGVVVKRFSSMTAPDSNKLRRTIESVL